MDKWTLCGWVNVTDADGTLYCRIAIDGAGVQEPRELQRNVDLVVKRAEVKAHADAVASQEGTV